jgi:4-amino-4-deoxy-L-arabinose transferase-like glycosyltransferase
MPHLARFARIAILLATATFTIAYFLVAIPRLLYPYDLDFVENGILMTALRLAHGQPVYIPPQAEFVPHVYMPLYTWLGGLLFIVTGPGYLPLRSLSLVAVMVIGSLLFWVGRRESGQSWLGLVCAGLFLGGYRINGFWYELARVDSLFVALSLAGLTLGAYGKGSRSGLVGAAAALALAFLAKQTGLILGVGVGVYLLITIRRRAWLFWVTYGLLTMIPVAILQQLSDGWFLYYTYHIASINPIEFGRIFNFMGYELFGLMGGLCLMTLGAALLTLRQTGWRGVWQQPWLIWVSLAVFISALGRASIGGNLNNRMMAYTLLTLSPALLMNSLYGYAKATWSWRSGLITVLILGQFALGIYNPGRYVPIAAMRRSGDRFIEKIAAEDGQVLVLMHPFYAWLAGKAPSAQIAAMWHARERGTLPLPPDFAARLENQYYAVIISDNSLFETEPELQRLLDAYYLPAEFLSPVEAPATSTGMIVRPEILYRPK